MSSSTPDPHLVASRIVETIREPLLVLDEEPRVVRAIPSFCRTFRASQDLAEGRRLDELGDGEWDVPALRSRLNRVLEEEEPFEGFEVVRSFPEFGRRVMRLNGRSLPWKAGESRTILLAIEDVTERLELEAELRRHAREFIDYAVDGARRMKALINGLLACSRVGRHGGRIAVSSDPGAGATFRFTLDLDPEEAS